jgi:ribosomal protein S18 acetylase RimI-like enzyme
MTDIQYRSDREITAEEFIDLLKRSTLGERRPIEQPERIQRMLDHANLLVTAWDGMKLVGVSRAVTDFSFCCYLSDLAVDERYQRRGIGKKLVDKTQEVAGEEAMLILLSAPAAMDYYPKIGMKKSDRCFILDRKR